MSSLDVRYRGKEPNIQIPVQQLLQVSKDQKKDAEKTRTDECHMVTVLQPAEMLEDEILLHHYTQENNIPEVRALVASRRVNINAVDNFDRTALMWAATNGHLDIMEDLIKGGATLDAADKYGMTALLWAVKNGHEDAVNMLITNFADILCCNKQGLNILHCASQNNHVDIISYIFMFLEAEQIEDKKGEKGQFPLSGILENASNPFTVEISSPFGKVQNLFDKQKAISGMQEMFQQKPLAMINSFVKEIDGLKTKKKGPVKTDRLSKRQEYLETLFAQKDKNGKTAFHLAVENSHTETVEKFLEYRRDLDVTDKNGHNVLHLAAMNGHCEIVNMLLRKECDIACRDHEGRTCLHLAVESGDLETVELLLNYEADARAETHKEMTPLHLAAILGHGDIITLLMEYESSVDLPNYKGDTPLHLAVTADQVMSAMILLQSNLDCQIDARNFRELTPLHCAVERGNRGMVELLLVSGANLYARDKRNKSALELACRNGDVEIVDLIIKAERFRERQKNGLVEHAYKFDVNNRVKVDLALFEKVFWRLTNKYFTKGDWKKLANVCDFSYRHINAIETDYWGPKTWKEHGYRMCIIWIHGLDEDAHPVDDLYDALYYIRKKRVAHKILKMFQPEEKKTSRKSSCVLS